MVVKSHRCANLILRCFQSRNRDSLLAGFKAYVRSIVEYNSVVWSPHLIKDIEAVEKVQRRFTKRLPGLSNLTYCQRLAKLNIDSLELRRIRADFIFMYSHCFWYSWFRLNSLLYYVKMTTPEVIILNCIFQLVNIMLDTIFLVIERLGFGTVCR